MQITSYRKKLEIKIQFKSHSYTIMPFLVGLCSVCFFRLKRNQNGKGEYRKNKWMHSWTSWVPSFSSTIITLDTIELPSNIGFVCGSLFLSLTTIPLPVGAILCRKRPINLLYSLLLLPIPLWFKDMSGKENGMPGDPEWLELKIPQLLFTDRVQELHAIIEKEWDCLQRSACQTAAGRALWKHVIHDQVADLLAGEKYLRNLHEKIKTDRLNNAREVSGVIIAVRTLWFDSKIQAALDSSSGGEAQVVLLGAGMDTRAYRLSCLKDSDVFEVDFPEVLRVKTTLLQAAIESTEHFRMKAKSLIRVAADVRETDWPEKLQLSGFLPEKKTVWVLEGILYYLSHSNAMQVLKIIADKCAVTQTVLLADFMNKPSTTLADSIFHFYSDWPDHMLPSLGFSHVRLSQIGDPDADFGLMNDQLNLFNKLRRLPRSMQTNPDDGTPCRRLYLVEASGSPNQEIP